MRLKDLLGPVTRVQKKKQKKFGGWGLGPFFTEIFDVLEYRESPSNHFLGTNLKRLVFEFPVVCPERHCRIGVKLLDGPRRPCSVIGYRLA